MLFRSEEAIKTLVQAFVLSQLDYCNSLLYGITKTQLVKLQRIQNSAARMITGTRKYDSITPVLKHLHWLPMNERIEFKVLVMVFKALHGSAPSYIQELIKPYTPRRTLRSASSRTVEVPVTRTSYGDRSFSKAGAHLWNNLPEDLRSVETLETFRWNLKTFLFRRAYN